MEKSQSIKELASALCKFQREVGKIKKDAANPFFKSKYATLSNILEAINEPLANNGLAVTQFPTGENELSTILMHVSGEFIEASYHMTPVKNDPQALGSAITYQRRYALGAVLGLNIDDDDDGNSASGKSTAKPTAPQTPSAEQPKKAVFLPSYLNNAEWVAKVCSWLEQGEAKHGPKFSAYNAIERNFSGVQSDDIQKIISKYNEYKRSKSQPAA